MAKDGTLRGGRRAGSGQKKHSIDERILNGSVSEEFVKHVDEAAKYSIPTAPAFIREKQKNADGAEAEIQIDAAKVYKRTYVWLAQRHCETMVSLDVIWEYAMNCARYMQAERYISRTGMLGEHPTTGAPIPSPYVAISDTYQKKCISLWGMISQVVKENCAGGMAGKSPQDEMMEDILGI